MGWIVLGVCAYVAFLLGMAAHTGNWGWLGWIFLPFLLPIVLWLAIGALFGSAAVGAVKQETGMGADGSRAYPYWVRRE
ncbi:hypothetical protein ACFT38_28325 [Streptomyces sp. NPDC056975]|uniref:hypothetical protein n=1 Tax=Streptomyces sp. NPDC056975 TaxID=3345985 RepID=UPI003627FE5F